MPILDEDFHRRRFRQDILDERVRCHRHCPFEIRSALLDARFQQGSDAVLHLRSRLVVDEQHVVHRDVRQPSVTSVDRTTKTKIGQGLDGALHHLLRDDRRGPLVVRRRDLDLKGFHGLFEILAFGQISQHRADDRVPEPGIAVAQVLPHEDLVRLLVAERRDKQILLEEITEPDQRRFVLLTAVQLVAAD